MSEISGGPLKAILVNSATKTTCDIGVFAHNEQDGIAALLGELARQDLFDDPILDLRVHILANGCTDATVGRANGAIAELPATVGNRIAVLDLELGGKSRTVHRFIHDIARRDATILGFMDADIVLPQADTIRRMIAALQDRPKLQAFTSCPIKDVVHDQLPTGLVGRIIGASGGGLADFKTAICGQLFVMRSAMARQIGLPAGLPVEDGFMRAMMLTDLLSAPENFDRIDGDEAIYHVYESIRTIPELIRHQVRIVIGSAINAVLFAKIRREAGDLDAAHALLMRAAVDENWLPDVIKAELPKWPYGYVPLHFLTWRVKAFFAGSQKSLRRFALLLLGFGFDFVVYVLASLRMMFRPSAGFW
ncbi:glycosyltransferase family 2 protein [Yoonia sp. R2331]|uniref:glycosyltransferase n=1 Tax=Yoonia sp. R2331 TaxID=3237238 RepID=UPI0034E37E0C